MGTVYRALDRLSGAPVALKLPNAAHARALAEADALAALDHPAIVRLVAHGFTDDGNPFLAMEWLEGEDLAARLERSPLGAADALLGARVAGALAAAHAAGMVHRDLKPSNLFLVGGEVAAAKLVDFGIARAPRAGTRLTATGMLIGTPGYMAPEQARGDREIGPATDLFALGAVLFECLAGPATG
jgi:serine/threonine protein kinase